MEDCPSGSVADTLAVQWGREKAPGPDHPDVAQSLENYAALLQKTNREAQAEKLEARPRAICLKLGSKSARK